jgi:hypothetical protein
VRTTLWRYHLGGGCVLALAYVYLPFAGLRVGALVVLCVATIAATLATIRLWRPAQRLPFLLFAAGRRSGSSPGRSGPRPPSPGPGGAWPRPP